MVLPVGLIPAVAYYRKSDDDEGISILQQQKEVRAWAKQQGYHVIREYVDEARSGSKDTEKRVNFQRMLLDAPKGEFRAVLCWATSRFGRLDSADADYALAITILRSNDIVLHTKVDGRIDYNTLEGRLLGHVKAEIDALYARMISADTVRGRGETTDAGWWAIGPIPYGYDRAYHDLHTGEVRHVPRTQKFRKPEHWKLKLCINEEEAKVVRFIYAEFLADTSTRQIAKMLNDRGVPVPSDWYRRSATKNGWTWDCVKGILQHKAYTGTTSIGHGRAKKKKTFNKVVAREKENCWPFIIPVEIWLEVQSRLAKNKKEKRKAQSSRAASLSGTLHCGECGYRLAKKVVEVYYCTTCGNDLTRQRRPECKVCGRTGKEKRPRVVYRCASSTRIVPGCPQWSVCEDEIQPYVVAKLIKVIDAELLTVLQTPRDDKPVSNLDILENNLTALKKKLRQAIDLSLDPDISPALRKQYVDNAEQLQKDVEDSEQRLQVLRAAENEGGVESFVNWWNETKGRLGAVVPIDAEERLERGEALPVVTLDPVMLRGLLRRLGVTVSVWWSKKNRRLFQPDWSRLDIDIEWHGSENLVEGHTSKAPEQSSRKPLRIKASTTFSLRREQPPGVILRPQFPKDRTRRKTGETA